MIAAADRMVELAFLRLSGDSTLSTLVGGRIGRDPVIPPAVGTAKMPYIGMGLQANPPPLTTLDATRVKGRPLLRVSIWATAGQGWNVVGAIAARIDTLLHGYRGVISGVTVGKFVDAGSDDLVETDVDGQALHRVLLYRSEIHPT